MCQLQHSKQRHQSGCRPCVCWGPRLRDSGAALGQEAEWTQWFQAVRTYSACTPQIAHCLSRWAAFRVPGIDCHKPLLGPLYSLLLGTSLKKEQFHLPGCLMFSLHHVPVCLTSVEQCDPEQTRCSGQGRRSIALHSECGSWARP